MRQQHRWIRQQLICCFIYIYTQAHHLPPTVREIGEWVGCPGMRSLQRALADLERQQYLTRQSHFRRSIVLTAKGITLAERWQLLVPVAWAVVEAPPAKPLHGNPSIPLFKIPPAQWPSVLQRVAQGESLRQIARSYHTSYEAVRRVLHAARKELMAGDGKPAAWNAETQEEWSQFPS